MFQNIFDIYSEMNNDSLNSRIEDMKSLYDYATLLSQYNVALTAITVMETSYKYIFANQNEFIEYDKQTPEFKIKNLQGLLSYFQSRERYEECANIVRLIKKVEDHANSKR